MAGEPLSVVYGLHSPTYAGGHSCQAVEEGAGGVLQSAGLSLWAACQSLGARPSQPEVAASAGSAEDTKRTTAARPPQ